MTASLGPALVHGTAVVPYVVSVLQNTSPAWIFTDDPLTTATPVRAVHITDLRGAINSLRTRLSLPAFSWTNASLTAGTARIMASDIVELRSALNDICDAVGLSRPSYTDPAIGAGTPIKRLHIMELRDAVRVHDWFVLTAHVVGSGAIFAPGSNLACGSTYTACVIPYPPGAAFSLVVEPGAGSTFAEWSGACTGAAPCQVTMNADVSITARFGYALTTVRGGSGTGTVTSSPTGVACGANCQAFDYGTVVTLTPTPAPGSVFSSWTGACSGSGACSVTMNSAKVVGASFTQQNMMVVVKAGTGAGTVTSSPAGISCGGDCQELYNQGTTVTLTASAIAGSYFAGWTDTCIGFGTSADCTKSMSADLSAGAVFNLATGGPLDLLGKNGLLGLIPSGWWR